MNKKLSQKSKERRLAFSKIGRVLTGFALTVLIISGLVGTARTITTVSLENQEGVPLGWVELASGTTPPRLVMPVTFYDQREDQFDGISHEGRQFEWLRHGGNPGYGLQQGIVQSRIGADGKPVPSYSSIEATQNAGFALVNRGVFGNNPVQPSDPFYRWFNEVDGLSKRFDSTLEFRLMADGSYQAGGSGRNFFPLDSIPEAMAFSAGDYNRNTGHNFHFTMQFQTPIIVEADGTEEFFFSGDDDVWVFLNGHLVFDLGGVHEILHGSFRIGTPNADGSIPIHSTAAGVSTTIPDIGLKAGEPAQLQLFYAERSTAEANALITIRNMNVANTLINTSPDEIVESPCEPVLINQSVSNADVYSPIKITGMTSWLNSGTAYNLDGGFVNFNDNAVLQYSFNPDSDSWTDITLNPPSNGSNNSLFQQGAITLKPKGQSGDTVHFRYRFQSNNCEQGLFNVLSVMTETLTGSRRVDSDNVIMEAIELLLETEEPIYEGGRGSGGADVIGNAKNMPIIEEAGVI